MKAPRSPLPDEIDAVVGLLNECDKVDQGFEDTSPGDIEWYDSSFSLERDAWVVDAGDRLAAYASAHDDYAQVFIHPAERGKGFGTELRRLVEARVLERNDGNPIAIAQFVTWLNRTAFRLLSGAGYEHTYSYHRMVTRLESPPPPAGTVSGVNIETFRRGHDEVGVFEVIDGAFKDIDGYTPERKELWLARFAQDDFSPELTFVARADAELAGAVVSKHYPNLGWIADLGVARAWRGRGLGRALLLSAFGALHESGTRRIDLTVSSRNTTGALGLYESVGMKPEMRYDRMEKKLG